MTFNEKFLIRSFLHTILFICLYTLYSGIKKESPNIYETLSISTIIITTSNTNWRWLNNDK